MTDEPPPNAAPDNRVVTPFRKRYEAFTESGLELPRLGLRTSYQHISILYSAIGVVVFHFLDGDELSFSTPEYDVTIRGRNLQPIADAMRRHGCGLVQEFDARHFLPPSPGDGRDTFVESISVELLHDVGKPKSKADEKA